MEAKSLRGTRIFDPSKYPYVFREVLTHFENRSEPLRVTFSTREKAIRMRFRWYNFTKALGQHGMKVDKATSDGVMVRLDGDTLEFLRRDDEEDVKEMQRQLYEQVGKPPVPGAEEIAKLDRELRAMIANEEKALKQNSPPTDDELIRRMFMDAEETAKGA